MNPVAVARAGTMSAPMTEYGAVFATATKTNTISGMSQTLHRFAKNGRGVSRMEKAKEISALWEQIKPQIDEMVHLCYEVESHYEVTADAYQRGYEAGLNDAWECAREIGKNSMCSLEEMGFDFSQCGVNDYNPSWFVVKNYSASEAIEKIEQYLQEQQFHVGDEFENESGKRFVIIKMNGNKIDRYVDEEGKTYCLFQEYRIMRKTGRHFPEISEVLRKMREGQEQ